MLKPKLTVIKCCFNECQGWKSVPVLILMLDETKEIFNTQPRLQHPLFLHTEEDLSLSENRIGLITHFEKKSKKNTLDHMS